MCCAALLERLTARTQKRKVSPRVTAGGLLGKASNSNTAANKLYLIIAVIQALKNQ